MRTVYTTTTNYKASDEFIKQWTTSNRLGGYIKLPFGSIKSQHLSNSSCANPSKCGYSRRDLVPTCTKCSISTHNSIRRRCQSSSSSISVSALWWLSIFIYFSVHFINSIDKFNCAYFEAIRRTWPEWCRSFCIHSYVWLELCMTRTPSNLMHSRPLIERLLWEWQFSCRKYP